MRHQTLSQDLKFQKKKQFPNSLLIKEDNKTKQFVKPLADSRHEVEKFNSSLIFLLSLR